MNNEMFTRECMNNWMKVYNIWEQRIQRFHPSQQKEFFHSIQQFSHIYNEFDSYSFLAMVLTHAQVCMIYPSISQVDSRTISDLLKELNDYIQKYDNPEMIKECNKRFHHYIRDEKDAFEFIYFYLRIINEQINQ